MNVGQVFVAIIVVVVGDHFLWLTLKAHALVAATTSHPVAPIRPHDGHLTALIGAFADPIFLHVLFESQISTIFGLFASEPRVVIQLAPKAVRLLALIAIEEVFDQEVHLLAPSGIAAGDYLWVSANVLIQCYVLQLHPGLRSEELLQVGHGDLFVATGALEGEHRYIVQGGLYVLQHAPYAEFMATLLETVRFETVLGADHTGIRVH